MTYETNLYAAHWLYFGLIGLGVVLFLASFGGAFLWAALLVLAALLLAALVAWRKGYTPRARLVSQLSEEGVTLLGHPHPYPGWGADMFFTWSQVLEVSLTPRPGYWQTWLLTSVDPEDWLQVGTSLDLAEDIAAIAGLFYDEARRKDTRMGREHYWRR
ncbi:MAG: hypothetical protein GXP42_09815 [Chloroflexi bacterium]|nr:hypothetical protein [Chloroflexota bacterium]